MSLKRLIYYSAIVGGWSAFFGWLVAELLLNRGRSDGGLLSVVLTCGLVGAAIGAGLNLLAGAVGGRLGGQLGRVVPGLVAGGVGGAIGGLLGNILYEALGLPRAVGWMIMGAGIGVVEGLYERSPAKLRNGLIGGAVGGLVGGFLFDPIVRFIASSSGMSGRATAFVILGLFIGMLIGLVKVVFREAWLTVLDGYRPGRQLILAAPTTVLGRAEYAALAFSGKSDDVVDMEHARVVRTTDGRFALEDNGSRHGTFLNGKPVHGIVNLNDGDVIKLGVNSIRFSERHRHGEAGAPMPAQAGFAMPTYTPATPLPVKAAPPPPRPTPPPAAPRPQTPVPPPPQAKPAVAPAPAPPGTVLCPGCQKPVPAAQRYCIRCDLYF